MPSLRSSVAGATPARDTSDRNYPKLLQGDSGSVWLITKPREGVIVSLSGRPQKAKHYLGYYSTKMVESKMRPFMDEVKLSMAS